MKFKPKILLSLLFIISVWISACDNNEDTDAPLIHFSSPSASDTVSSRTIVKLDISESGTIAYVNLFADDIQVNDSSLTRAPYEWAIITAAYPDDHPLVLRAEAADISGNVAVPAVISVITHNQGIPPASVDNFFITDTTKHSVRLKWKPSADLRFDHYEVRRSLRNSTEFPDSAAASISDISTGEWTDTGAGESIYGLMDDSEYSYKLLIVTSDTLYSDSKTLRARTRLPETIHWNVPAIINRSKSHLSLAWQLTAEDKNDVDVIELHRIVGDQDTLYRLTPAACSVGDNDYQYQDTDLKQLTTYYYQLRQYDKLGFVSYWNDGVSDMTSAFSFSLNAAVVPGKYSVVVSHSPYNYSDFASYEYFITRGSDTYPNDGNTPLITVKNASETSHTFRPLAQQSDFVLHIRLKDAFDNEWVESYPFHTDSLAAPQLTVLEYGKYFATLQYTRYDPVDNDFARYFIFRSDLAGPPPLISAQGWSIYDISQTQFTDTQLKPDQIAYYFAAIIDTSGAYAFSDPVYILSNPVAIAEIDTIIVDENPFSNEILWIWTSYEDPDFQEFRLYRSSFQSSSGDYGIDSLINVTTTMSFIDYTIQGHHSYRYMVRVIDDRGNYRNSPALEVNSNLPPPALVLKADSISHSEAWLSWNIPIVNEAPISDFMEYKLYRCEFKHIIPDSLTETLDPRIKQVTKITELMTNHYTDINLSEGNIYYYRLYVFDSGGAYKGSNEAEIITNP